MNELEAALVREAQLKAALAGAYRAIDILLDGCRAARKDCMHPRSNQARALDAAVERVEAELPR